jgi:hypothetical protein
MRISGIGQFREEKDEAGGGIEHVAYPEQKQLIRFLEAIAVLRQRVGTWRILQW